MQKLGLFIGVIGVMALLVLTQSACNNKRPFACFRTDVDPDSIYVGKPVTFMANCSSNSKDYYWEFYENEDSTYFGYSVTVTFYQPGDVNVFLLTSNNNSTSSTSEVIKVKP